MSLQAAEVSNKNQTTYQDPATGVCFGSKYRQSEIRLMLAR